MASFPALASGYATVYPLARGLTWATRVLRFGDDTEQRFSLGAGRQRLTLAFEGLRKADADLIRTFHSTVKGAFDTTWDITVDGVTIGNLAAESDDLEVTETSLGRYSVRLACRQVKT